MEFLVFLVYGKNNLLLPYRSLEVKMILVTIDQFLNSIIPKLCKAIISKKLSSLLLYHISPTQHGFLAKHSIFTNLLV